MSTTGVLVIDDGWRIINEYKYVAIALPHRETPPIFNATDSDWWQYRAVLEEHGITVNFLCLDAMLPTD